MMLIKKFQMYLPIQFLKYKIEFLEKKKVDYTRTSQESILILNITQNNLVCTKN